MQRFGSPSESPFEPLGRLGRLGPTLCRALERKQVGMDNMWQQIERVRTSARTRLARTLARGWLVVGGLAMACTIEDIDPGDDAELDDAELDDEERAAEAMPGVTRCQIDCWTEAAICADEALVRKAKCNNDTCLRDAHRTHASALLECKRLHPVDIDAMLLCSSQADTVLIAAMMACAAVPSSTTCTAEYDKDMKACKATEKACLAACPAAPANP